MEIANNHCLCCGIQTVSVSLGTSLSIKRKYKVPVNGSMKKWWYVVWGEKSDVELLEKEWGKINSHAYWLETR